MSLLRPTRFIHLSLLLGALATLNLAQAQSASQSWTLPLTQAQQAQTTKTQTTKPQTPMAQTQPQAAPSAAASKTAAATSAPVPIPPIPATPASPGATDVPASSSQSTSSQSASEQSTPDQKTTTSDTTAPDTTTSDTSTQNAGAPATSSGSSKADTSKAVTGKSDTAPMTVKLKATLPALVHGKKTTLPLGDTLTIPADVVAGVKKANQLTPQAAKLLSAFVTRTTGPARDARFELQEDGSWAVVQRNALSVDMVAAKLSLQQAILQGDTTFVMLPTVGKAPNRTLDYFASRGITDFLAAGKTNYDGSSKARMTNIHAGTHFFQDRLFEGKEFSFNKFIGPITEQAGYVPGLVIAGERTASGIGGGICQVSTTVFRALYGAGLSIKERRNHSYQVYYYAPQGLDATIYQPTQDLRFANDVAGKAAGPLWFQSTWDDKTGDLVVMVFGKPRGFEVQIKEPRVLKTTPAPADKIIVDNTLKPGQKKQVDWAAQGAVVEVDRLFVKGGNTIHKDTLKSSYRPWPNIFLVGSKPAAK